MATGIPALRHHSDGLAHGEVLFFVQGWPDDHTVWDELVAALGDRYRCVRVDLPNYGDAEYARWGYDHEAIAAALAQCIQRVSPGRPVTLIAHDWGAYWAYLVHHRNAELVSRLIALDVGPQVVPRPHEALLIAAYQWWLTAAFIGGGPIGDWMTRRMAQLAGSPRQGAALRSAINYPYLYTWRDLLTGRRRALLKGYRPQTPVLFVYGEKKPMRFHTDGWTQALKRQPGSRVLGLPNTGHWVMRDPALAGEVRAWLQSTQPAPAATH